MNPPTTEEEAQPAELAQVERERQIGDVRLYIVFIKSIGWAKFSIWVLLTIALAIMEQFPDVFLRIWVDTAPDNKLYFIGYCTISAAAFSLCVLMLGFVLS